MSNEFDYPDDSSFDDVNTPSLDSVEPYEATPISEISIMQDDGSVDSLANIMAANADTDTDVTPDVEPYQARPLSEIDIVQVDGSVDSLANIMAANADTDTDVTPDVEPYQARPLSEIDIVQDDGSVDSLANIMVANADTDTDVTPDVEPQGVPDFTDTPDVLPVDADDTAVDAGTDLTDTNDSAYAQLMAYMSDHNYGRQHEAEYTQDPEWQELNNAFRIEQGLEPIDYGTQDWTDTHVDDIRAELVAMGIPEDSPELEAILQNEQQGIDQIHNGEMDVDDSPVELDSDVIDTADEVVDGDDGSDIGDVVLPTSDPIHMTQSDVDWYMDNTGDAESLRQMRDGIASGRIIVDADTEIPSDAAIEGISDVPADIDYDAVYSGLDSYDFDGIDVSTDVERLDSSLDSFQSGTWENLSTDEQKAAMSDLADYVKDVIGFENPPDIVYYNNPVDGDYGGYSPGTNTLSVNEYMLYDNNEAADTIAHELWHAYQHERAMNPQSAKDYQYQYGFDNYIRPDDDFTAYQDQLVEAEARAFAQQFKDRLRTKGRSI